MLRTLTIDPLDPDPAAIAEAVRAFRDGEAVVYPTDTVYGLGTDARDARAVNRLFGIKGRPLSRAMPLLIGEPGQLLGVAGHLVGKTLRLTELFWPGALTIVVPGRSEFAHVASPGGAIGVRLPDHEVPRRIALELGGPLVGTSANRTGQEPPRDPREAAASLGEGVGLLLDAGPLAPSKGSTVLDATQRRFRVLREGDVTIEALREAVPDAEFETI